jgi:hypothetical protein
MAGESKGTEVTSLDAERSSGDGQRKGLIGGGVTRLG